MAHSDGTALAALISELDRTEWVEPPQKRKAAPDDCSLAPSAAPSAAPNPKRRTLPFGREAREVGVLELPFGGLIYTRHDEEADQICDEVFGDSSGARVLGFDIEWKVTYVTDEVRGRRPAPSRGSAD